MTLQAKHLKAFVASPSDIKDERVILEEVVVNINKLFGARFGLVFDLIKWETDTHPGVGDDAQSVINHQIKDDYDVLIGILWTRIGTPTKRNISGTVEEIMRAYQKAKEKPEETQLMVYFRNSPVSPDEVDGYQISQVHEFKKKLGDLGVYWWSYNSIRDFERHIRLHLQNVLLDFRDKNDIDYEKGIESNVSIDNIPVEDLGSIVVEAINLTSKSAIAIGESIKLLGKRAKARTSELETAIRESNFATKVITVLDGFSVEQDEFSTQVELEVPKLSSNFRVGMDNIIKLASFVGTPNKELVEKIINVLMILRINALDLITNLNKNRDVYQGFLGRSLKLNVSTTRLLKVIDNLIEEYETQISLATEAVKVYENIRRINL